MGRHAGDRLWSGCAAARPAAPRSWEGRDPWQGRVALTSTRWAGLGLRAHSMSACPTPRGGDSVWMAAGSLPSLALCKHVPAHKTEAGGRLPGPVLCAGTCVSGLWRVLAAPGPTGRSAGPPGPAGHWDAQHAAVVVFTPGPSLLSQPPHFSTTSTCSTAPSQSSARERPARRWPCATRESLPGCGPAPAPSLAPLRGLLSRVLAGAAPPVPVGQGHGRQSPARGGTRWCGSCWGTGCQEPARGWWPSSLGLGMDMPRLVS